MSELKVSRQMLLAYLATVERKFPVETWKINDIHVWPLIKIELFFRVVNLERRGLSQKDSPKKSPFQILLIVIRTLPSLLNYFVLKAWSKKAGKKISCFFSDSGSHRVWLEKRFINRYFSPLEEQIKEIKNNASFLTINDDSTDYERYPKDENILFVQKYINGAKIVRYLNGDKTIFDCARFEEFLMGIQQEFPSLKVRKSYAKDLRSRVFNIQAASDVIDVLIQRHQPKAIFELCYYNTLRFAINYSAYKNKIPTVEIQHGGMGRGHVAYSGWGKVPQEGYNLLPQTFWAWDRNSEHILTEWTKGNSFHHTVLGGNPWLMFALKHSGQYQFPANKKIILYTLQTDMVSEYIYEAIEKSSDEYEWWVRVHPRFPQIGVALKAELERRGTRHRVVLERANKYPLPILLDKSGIHMSGSSGSILEASLLGVPSLVLNQAGEKYYHELIVSGEASPVHPKTSSHLLLLIDKFFSCGAERVVENQETANILRMVI